MLLKYLDGKIRFWNKVLIMVNDTCGKIKFILY